MAVVEEDYRYKMVSSISKVETSISSIQECLESLGKRVTDIEHDCIRRSALWSVAIITATLFSGVFASYYTSSSSQQKLLEDQAKQQTSQEKQQTALQEQMKRLADTAEDNRKALESWFKTNAKRN